MRHPYTTCSQSKIIDELEQARAENVNQLKEQMSEILEILQSSKRQKATQMMSRGNGEGPDMPIHPTSFTPNMQTPKMSSQNVPQQ